MFHQSLQQADSVSFLSLNWEQQEPIAINIAMSIFVS